MIQRVFERAKLAKTPSQVIVATDDERILQAVEAFGGEARITRSDHRTGKERSGETASGSSLVCCWKSRTTDSIW